MQFIAPVPFREAASKLGSRTPIGSALTSAQWSAVPVELRERAIWSSRIESVRFAQRFQGMLADWLAGARDENGMLKMGSRAEFISLLSQFALAEGMGPVDPNLAGTLQDITSEKRLGLIFDIQDQAAKDYGYWRQGQDPDVLDAFPAQRFIRVQAVKEPRETHQQFENGVWLKNDPIWATRINEDFGVPWGPWGWGCGHDVEDVDRAEAESLGLLEPGEAVQPDDRNFNENLQASAKDLDPELLTWLKEQLGDQISFDGDTLKWKGSEHEQQQTPVAPQSDGESGRIDRTDLVTPRSVGRSAEAILDQILSRDLGIALPPDLAGQTGASLASVIEGRKPLYHEHLINTAAELADQWSRLMPAGVQVRAVEGHLYVYRREVIRQILWADPEAYPGKTLIEQIHTATVAGQNGDLLGYGAPNMAWPGSVRVQIHDAQGTPVFGFRSRPELADRFGRERAMDFSRYFGKPFGYDIIPNK